MIALAFSTFSSNVAARASDAWAMTGMSSEMMAAARGFILPRLQQAAGHEIGDDGHRLLTHLMPHRELVIVDVDAMLFEHAACAVGGEQRDHIVRGSVHDQHRQIAPERRKIVLENRATHHDEAGELDRGAEADVD